MFLSEGKGDSSWNITCLRPTDDYTVSCIYQMRMIPNFDNVVCTPSLEFINYSVIDDYSIILFDRRGCWTRRRRATRSSRRTGRASARWQVRNMEESVREREEGGGGCSRHAGLEI